MHLALEVLKPLLMTRELQATQVAAGLGGIGKEEKKGIHFELSCFLVRFLCLFFLFFFCFESSHMSG
jgi:hypothetical protein